VQLGKFSAVEVRLKSGELLLLREVTPTDAPQVVAYVEAIASESDFLTFGPGEFGITIEQEKAYLASVLSRDNTLYIIAVIDGEIVGSLSFVGGADLKQPISVSSE
jgi:hypothetical protein